LNAAIQATCSENEEWEPFQIGIGIHTGTAVLGNIGTTKKTEFTAIGETVNTAARLVEISKTHPNSIILSDAVANAIRSHYDTRSLGDFTLRGLNRQMTVEVVTAEKLGAHSVNTFRDKKVS